MYLKKLFCLLLALCLLLTALTACERTDNSQQPDNDKPPAATSGTTGEDATQTDPGETDPTVTDPSQTDPPETDPNETDPPETNPTETEPVQTDPTEPEDESQISPLLYKVEDKDGNVVWLFGSIHVGVESYYPLPNYVLSAYESADALAVECDVIAAASDSDLLKDVLLQLLYLDGTKISDHIPEDLYIRAVEVMKECDLYTPVMDIYYPVLWSNFIDNTIIEEMDVDSELGIDTYFLNDAYDTGKEILEIESVEFQYGMLGGFSDALQAMLLESSIYSYEHLDEHKADLDLLMNTWASGDEQALAAILAEETEFENEEEKALYKEYNDAMIVSRNIAMADYAEHALASGKEVFICVGAAHVVGEGAMADLLAQRGYTVERVAP